MTEQKRRLVLAFWIWRLFDSSLAANCGMAGPFWFGRLDFKVKVDKAATFRWRAGPLGRTGSSLQWKHPLDRAPKAMDVADSGWWELGFTWKWMCTAYASKSSLLSFVFQNPRSFPLSFVCSGSKTLNATNCLPYITLRLLPEPHLQHDTLRCHTLNSIRKHS